MSDLNNYRPISNLSFLSKTVERLVDARFVAYADSNSLLVAYRTQHSTLDRDNTCSPVQRQVVVVGTEMNCVYSLIYLFYESI